MLSPAVTSAYGGSSGASSTRPLVQRRVGASPPRSRRPRAIIGSATSTPATRATRGAGGRARSPGPQPASSTAPPEESGASTSNVSEGYGGRRPYRSTTDSSRKTAAYRSPHPFGFGSTERNGTLIGVTRNACFVDLGTVDYREAWDLQRSVATAVADGLLPDTVLFLEHPPTVTLGRRADPRELHIPEGAEVEVVETDRGGKSTYHGPGQLVCYPILDLTRHGQDVKRYCRDLEETLIRTLAAFGLEATRIDGLTGVWLERPPRKIASIGIHLTKWISTHGYALNVDLDPAPFTEWITACGLDGYQFTSMARELGRPVSVDEVVPHAVAALEDVFSLRLEPARELVA